MDKNNNNNELLEKIKSQLEEDKKQRRAMIDNTNALFKDLNIYIIYSLVGVTILLARYSILVASQMVKLPSTNILFIVMAVISAVNAGIIIFSIKLSFNNKTFKQFFVTFVLIILNIITNPIVLYYFYNQK